VITVIWGNFTGVKKSGKKQEKLSTLKARLWRLTSEFVRRSMLEKIAHVPMLGGK